MDGWVILLAICVAALCGAIIEHKRLQENYEFRMDHLHTCYLEQIKRNAKLTETLAAEHAEPVDVILDRLLQDCPDESKVESNG
jgi:dsRNA-specific ribonuclease